MSQCPDCGESFRGDPPACPHCGIELFYGDPDAEQPEPEGPATQSHLRFQDSPGYDEFIRELKAQNEHRCPRCHIGKLNRCRADDGTLLEHPHPERVELVREA